MDLSKFKTPDWLMIGGGIGVLIFGFLSWLKVDAGGFSTSGANVFDFTFTGTFPWLFLIAAAVLVVLLRLDVLKPNQAPWPLILLALCGLGAFLLLIRLVFNPLPPFFEGTGVSRGIGMILTFVASLVSLGGAVMNFTQSGASFSNLLGSGSKQPQHDGQPQFQQQYPQQQGQPQYPQQQAPQPQYPQQPGQPQYPQHQAPQPQYPQQPGQPQPPQHQAPQPQYPQPGAQPSPPPPPSHPGSTPPPPPPPSA